MSSKEIKLYQFASEDSTSYNQVEVDIFSIRIFYIIDFLRSIC